MLCGLLWVAGIGSVLAIVLARRARVAIKWSDGRQRGEWLIVAATIAGWLGLGVPLLLGLV